MQEFNNLIFIEMSSKREKSRERNCFVPKASVVFCTLVCEPYDLSKESGEQRSPVDVEQCATLFYDIHTSLPDYDEINQNANLFDLGLFTAINNLYVLR